MGTVKINGIPVYAATVADKEGEGMLRVSLVDDPAVMSDFQVFANQKQPQLFAVEDEAKRLVYGVVMRADFPIYRRDDKREYYMIFSADTIRFMAQKYLGEGRANEVNLMHQDGSEVEGVKMVQFFIRDAAKGVAPQGFDEIADGSLFAEYHVENDEVWQQIKDGTFRGFSLEGYFGLIPETDKEYVEKVVEETEGKFRKAIRFEKFTTKAIENMGKFTKLVAALGELLAKFGAISTDKGILVWDGDSEKIEVGAKVSIQGETEGDNKPAEDGEYVTEDGTTIVVAGGEVTDVREPQQEPQGGEGGQQSASVSAEDQTGEGGTGSEGGEGGKDSQEPKDEDSVEERIAKLEKIVAQIAEAFGFIILQRQEMKALGERVTTLESKPAAEPAHQDYQKIVKPAVQADEDLKSAVDRISAFGSKRKKSE